MSNTAITLKVNELSELVTNYIVSTTMKESLQKMSKNSFMLWGPPGVGKSDSLKTIQQKVSEKTNKEVKITDVRLLLFNPVDLRGIPVPDVDRKFAIWLKPFIFQMDPSPNVINLLMLDEISAAPPSVQAAAYQITLDRKVGEHKLPDNCYIICAGNRLQDKSVAYKMPKALANRLTHFDITAELDDWKIWAMNAGIDEKIIGYLNFSQKLYDFKPESDENAFPTPRTWEMADNYLKVFGSLGAAYNCIAGCIGLGTASEFKRYCEVFDKIPDVEKIFEGKDVQMPESSDILYALSAAISNKAKSATTAQLQNALKFVTKMRAEFSVLTIKDMLLIPKMKQQLIVLPEWLEWSKKNRALIV